MGCWNIYKKKQSIIIKEIKKENNLHPKNAEKIALKITVKYRWKFLIDKQKQTNDSKS